VEKLLQRTRGLAKGGEMVYNRLSMTQTEGDNMGNTITVEKAAQLSGYHPEWIRRLVRHGVIAARKIGRMWFVDKRSFQDYLDRQGK
jgi:excisionase family DNA binding protein